MNQSLPRAWAKFRWESSFAQLPEAIFRLQEPTPVKTPAMVVLNESLAQSLALDVSALASPDGVKFLAGNQTIQGLPTVAQAYAGHQFGHFTILGDGRALLIGEHRRPDGKLVDVQWKGSGRTVYSRGGDGRLALGPALREYLVSEAMAALGIPTTRSLAVVATGEGVARESMLPGAVLTRIASSHVRVGSFEWARVLEDAVAQKALVDFCIARHYPQATSVREFFEAVVDRQASLVAEWLSVGFVHGVMNTDNTTISGETIDFGPCAFLDVYDPETVFSSIDRHGRYSYGQQPGIVAWNLARLGDSLLPQLATTPEEGVVIANEVLETFVARFGGHFTRIFGAKLGLSKPVPDDTALIHALLKSAHQEKFDFHQLWQQLTDAVTAPDRLPFAFREWATRWTARLQQEARPVEEVAKIMRGANPRMIPRNHQVEIALANAQEGDMKAFQRLLAAVQKPFEDSAEARELGAPPATQDPDYRTFCGT